MNRRRALIVAAAILISVVAILIGWILGQGRQGLGELKTMDSLSPGVADGESAIVELFFPGPGGRLFAEEREIAVQDDLVALLETILSELLAGPATEDLFPALPAEASVDWLYLNPAGVFYVDLSLAGEESLPAWGSRQEMLAVYSIVNSILAAAPEISSVVLLRNGQQQSTFAGHLDTSRPLLANQQLIATR